MPISPLGISHAISGLVLLGLGLRALTATKGPTTIHPKVGEAYFWLLAVTLTGGMIIGTQDPELSLFEVVTPPTFLLGLLGYLMVKLKPKGWLRWHIVGQGGSYIGVITAFGFQVFPRFLPQHPVLTTLYWLVPSLVGTVLIARTITKWTAKARPAPAAMP